MKSMGGVAVLHPQDNINNKKSRRAIKYSHAATNLPTNPPTFTDSRKQGPPKGILKKSNQNSEHMKTNPIEFFAGSAFVESPPPSSVPLPGFFTKNFVAPMQKNDPTTELRRILGLSLS
ncbi:hypothetical protein CTI12_AA612420 [Artemisia annua]|uniref:Uncharacterized protein n=1 Tax=Artemisia annua TaxID=35608 RepID=A0A2U1KEI2_ARTAN|nr:hypothetical protein CTI12_AA612420 [Artemisia annua]